MAASTNGEAHLIAWIRSKAKLAEKAMKSRVKRLMRQRDTSTTVNPDPPITAEQSALLRSYNVKPSDFPRTQRAAAHLIGLVQRDHKRSGKAHAEPAAPSQRESLCAESSSSATESTR